MRKRIWIKSDLFNWPVIAESMDSLDDLNCERGYEIWKHAASKLGPDATEMDRVDAITTLKRCLNQRLKQFESVYKLRLFLQQNNNRYLQLLENLGIVRPMFLKYLMEIRNEIEHEDKKPPKLERCLELLDVVWYFLRSTDPYMRFRTSTLLFDTHLHLRHSQYSVEMDISIKRTWKIKIRGRLPGEFISRTYVSNFLEIFVEELCSANESRARAQEWFEQLSDSAKQSTMEIAKGSSIDDGYFEPKDTDQYISGSIVKLPNKLEFARLYFAAR